MKRLILAAMLCLVFTSTASAQVSVNVGGGRFFGQRQFNQGFNQFRSPFFSTGFSAYHAPIYRQPVFAPIYSAPVYSAPVFSAPIYAAPQFADPCSVHTYSAPIYSAPAFVPFRSFRSTIIVR